MDAPYQAPETEPCIVDLRKERCCLKCRTTFLSEGPGERVCRKCKSSSHWR